MIPRKVLLKSLVILSMLGMVGGSLKADERTHSPEQMEALAKSGNIIAELPAKLRNLPDLTKGDPRPVYTKKPPTTWTLGPTGVVGLMIGKFEGYQFAVDGALRGSPAEGKIFEGDVVTGVN